VQEMIDKSGEIDETTAAVAKLEKTLTEVIGPGTVVNEYLKNLRDDTSTKLGNIQADLDTFHDQFIADLKTGALVDVNVDVTVENGGGSTGVAYDPNRPWLTPHELPQLAGGMEYVPSNKYGPVYLDEAEAVLTAPQARQWRGDSSGGDLNITFQTLLKVADAGGVDGKKLFRQFENELLEAFAQRSLKDNRFLQKLRARLEKVQ
jgi:hypothetical protein